MKKKKLCSLAAVGMTVVLLTGCISMGTSVQETSAQETSAGSDSAVGSDPAEDESNGGDTTELTAAGMGSDGDDTGTGLTYNGAAVASNGSIADAAATIKGSNASVVYDEELDSNVLLLDGSSFGDAYLLLPEDLYEGVTDGFTFAMKLYLQEDAADYTRVFQSTSIPFGKGESWYDAPDISLDLCSGTAFRSTVFVGPIAGTYNTTDSIAYRTINSYEAGKTKGKWVDLVFVVSRTEGVIVYYDGGKTNTGLSTTTLSTLFDDGWLEKYVYNALGHSVYEGDNDIKAKYDDVAVYNYALTEDQATAEELPSDAIYLWDFDDEDITMAEEESAVGSESVYTDGTELSKIKDVSSPSGTVTASIWTDEATGRYFYSVSCNGDSVLYAAQLGLVTSDGDLSSGLTLETDSYVETEIQEEYELLSGKDSSAVDSCTQLEFALTKGTQSMTITLRVYDDGAAYRYTVSDSSGADVATITSEVSEFVLPDDTTLWYASVSDTYEGTYTEISMSNLFDRSLDASTPILANVAGTEDDYWVLLTEANVFNEDEPYCASVFSADENSKNLKWVFGNNQDTDVQMTYPFHTPWRVAIIGTSLDDTTNSDMLTSLNPAADEDTDWSFVEPGVAAWSWWSTTSDAIEPDTQKDYIDFAAENGWEYVLIDYGWELWDNYVQEVEELVAYAEEKGIGIFLWYGVDKYDGTHIFDLDNEETIEEQFAWCQEIGVRGVKIDYINSDSQEAMKIMGDISSIAAEHELMVVFHGCTNPNGETRTYPNVISYEAVKGEEYFKWNMGADIETLLTYLYTRNALGSMDFTPAACQITTLDATTGFQLAMSVVYESGVQHFSHSAYVYEGTTQLSFLNDVPTAWDESIVDGYPGDWNLAARKSGDDWYLGVMTLEEGTKEIALDFLDSGVSYTAYIYEDNSDGSAVEIRTEEVTSESTLTLELLEHGGAAVKITKGTMTTTTASDTYVYYEAEDATLGGATTIDANNYASGLASVGWVGNGAANSVTFENVTVDEAGNYRLNIYYITGEARSLCVSINGGDGILLSGLTATANDWSAVGKTSIVVSLEEGVNTITLYNASAYAPSIDRIAVSSSTVEEEALEPTEGNSEPESEEESEPESEEESEPESESESEEESEPESESESEEESEPESETGDDTDSESEAAADETPANQTESSAEDTETEGTNTEAGSGETETSSGSQDSTDSNSAGADSEADTDASESTSITGRLNTGDAAFISLIAILAVGLVFVCTGVSRRKKQ